MCIELEDKEKQEVENSCDAAMENTNGSERTYIPGLHPIKGTLPINDRSTHSFISVSEGRVSCVILIQYRVKILQEWS